MSGAKAERLAPGLARVLAPNPSPLTERGTNTYILGDGPHAVIDPGPAIESHLEAILRHCADGITHILVTHAHRDHSELARPLAEACGAPVLAFGDALAGRSELMAALAQSGDLGGAEGVDGDFRPDQLLADGDEVSIAGAQLIALHTPGHMGNHLSFAWRDAVFCGDIAMGWSTTLISPPDGDVSDFMASCARLAERPESTFFPGHGAPITDPKARLAELIAHRKAREAQVVAALTSGPETAWDITTRVYTDTPKSLWPAAARNVLAHLIDLTRQGRAAPEGPLTATAAFHLR